MELVASVPVCSSTSEFGEEVKFVAEFEYGLNTMRSVKAAIIYFMQNLLGKIGTGPKIFAIDNMAAIFNLRCYIFMIKI